MATHQIESILPTVYAGPLELETSVKKVILLTPSLAEVTQALVTLLRGSKETTVYVVASNEEDITLRGVQVLRLGADSLKLLSESGIAPNLMSETARAILGIGRLSEQLTPNTLVLTFGVQRDWLSVLNRNRGPAKLKVLTLMPQLD